MKHGLGCFKLCLLALVVFHHQSYGVNHISPIAEEVKQVINEISDCHVHILYDELDLNGPISNRSVTIWKTNASRDTKLRKGVKCGFRKLDLTRVKGIHCVYAMMFLTSQNQVYAYKKKPSSGSGPPVWVKFNRVISYAFDTLRNCFWKDRSLPVWISEPVRKLSSYSYVLFFTRFRQHQWLQILEADPRLLSSRTGLRFFSVASATAKAYLQCSFCPNEIPLLIPMKKADQGDINAFNAFTRKSQHKVLKVQNEIDSINYEWFTNELNQNLLSSSRAFDIPKLFHGLLMELSSTKLGHELFILNVLAKHYNATVILCHAGINLNLMCDPNQVKNRIHHSPIILPNNEQLSIENYDVLDTLGSSLIVAGVEGQKFLTCYHEQTISFRFYMAPFERDLWIVLAFSTLLIAVLLHIFIVKFHKSKMLKFSPYMFILSTITDANCAMPGGLAREPVIRIALGPWFLMTVVMVNAYVGLVITGLTSPLPTESVDSFSKLTKMHFNPEQIARSLISSRNAHVYNYEIKMMNIMDEERLFSSNRTRDFNPEIDFKIYSSRNQAVDEMYLKFTIFSDPQQARDWVYQNAQAFSSVLLNRFFIFCESERILYQQIMNRNLSIELRKELLTNATIAIPTMEDAILLNLVVPVHMSVPTSYLTGKWNYSYASAVEEEIIKCGRSAYAAIRSVVELEHKYLTKHYPRIKFFISKEEIYKEMYNWMFPGMDDKAPIFQGMKALLVTGVYRKLEEYFMKGAFFDRELYTTSSEYSNLKSRQEKSALSLADSIQTAFFLFGLAVSVSLLTLACECFWYYKKVLGSETAMQMDRLFSLSRRMFAMLYGVLSNYLSDLAILAWILHLIRRIHNPKIFERHG
jgi:hypothetical protein